MFTRHKSRRSRAGDLISKYMKIKVAGKGAKGAGKAAKWTAYAKLAKAVKRPPKKAWLALAGGTGAAALAVRKRRSTPSGTTGPSVA